MYRISIKGFLPGAIVASALGFGVALADDDATTRCAREDSADERIRCLEEAYLELAARDTETASSSEKVQTLSEFATSGSVAGETASGHATADAKAPAGSKASSVESDAGVSAADIEQFGARENPADESKIDAIRVNVVSVSNNAYGKLIYTTDSGQQWLQTDTKNMRYRQIPFEAEIRQAAAGGFFLQPSTGGVAIRVRRTN